MKLNFVIHSYFPNTQHICLSSEDKPSYNAYAQHHIVNYGCMVYVHSISSFFFPSEASLCFDDGNVGWDIFWPEARWKLYAENTA